MSQPGTWQLFNKWLLLIVDCLFCLKYLSPQTSISLRNHLRSRVKISYFLFQTHFSALSAHLRVCLALVTYGVSDSPNRCSALRITVVFHSFLTPQCSAQPRLITSVYKIEIWTRSCPEGCLGQLGVGWGGGVILTMGHSRDRPGDRDPMLNVQ